MNRKTLFYLALFAIVLLYRYVKPHDDGRPHEGYFRTLNEELKTNGPGRPLILLDLDRLDENLKKLNERTASPLRYRIVVKSLPSLDLLRYIARSTNSRRLMVFHGPDVRMLLSDAEFRSYDILLGKPMPANAVREILNAEGDTRTAQWVVDTKERLEEYAAIAREKNVPLRVNFEIDIGLHRGGFSSPEEVNTALEFLSKNRDRLTFSGFMGYEPHVASVPAFGDKKTAMKEALLESLTRYREFVDAARGKFPDLLTGDLTFNGGGSKTYSFYQTNPGPVNDVSAGSALVKPTDFDVESLEDHAPAVFIAAPVLKRLDGTTIPFLEKLSFLFPFWNPNRQLTYFLYGGGYLAKVESPAGLIENSIYGFSTNQAMLNGSLKTDLRPDDFVFFRPTQSEKVMAEMREIYTVRNGKLAGIWKCF